MRILNLGTMIVNFMTTSKFFKLLSINIIYGSNYHIQPRPNSSQDESRVFKKMKCMHKWENATNKFKGDGLIEFYLFIFDILATEMKSEHSCKKIRQYTSSLNKLLDCIVKRMYEVSDQTVIKHTSSDNDIILNVNLDDVNNSCNHGLDHENKDQIDEFYKSVVFITLDQDEKMVDEVNEIPTKVQDVNFKSFSSITCKTSKLLTIDESEDSTKTIHNVEPSFVHDLKFQTNYYMESMSIFNSIANCQPNYANNKYIFDMSSACEDALNFIRDLYKSNYKNDIFIRDRLWNFTKIDLDEVYSSFNIIVLLNLDALF